MKYLFFFFYTLVCLSGKLPIEGAQVILGVERLFNREFESILRGKRIGLITNHTAVNSHLKTTHELIKSQASKYNYTLSALFAPEHGLTGTQYAGEKVLEEKDPDGIPIYSLHGDSRRPTKQMLQDLNLLIYDVQDIGSRSYTYISTLFYVMEEAAKYQIPVLVLDRPNPINGTTIDGPMLEEKWRSNVGYINVPYCHGMTIGELAQYFNEEYHIGCQLSVVPMRGWKRGMTFADTGLKWIPTSPNIPEASTAFFYPSTGIIGELQLVNIGVGYTLPFKIVGAPWIDASCFANHLNSQHFPGVFFYPFYFRPFFGKFAQEDCQGVLIMITNQAIYLPVSTQYLILGSLKSLYPKEFKKAFDAHTPERLTMIHKVNGTETVYQMLKNEKYIAWKLREFHHTERSAFAKKREKYLIPDYK